MAKKGQGFIINLDDKGNEGSHWTAARLIGDTLYYADPFGTIMNGYPPQELANVAPNHINNVIAFQHPSTQLCGYYAQCFVDALNELKEGASSAEFHHRLIDSVL